MPIRLAILVFFGAFAVDLLTKQWVVSHADVVIFNDTSSQLPLRLVMSAVAIAVAAILGRLAGLRGLGRQWGLWIGVPLLVAGLLANGVSSLLWSQGVPDFLNIEGGWVWNVADFEIVVGLTGGILSVLFSAVFVYTRERVGGRRV